MNRCKFCHRPATKWADTRFAACDTHYDQAREAIAGKQPEPAVPSLLDDLALESEAELE